MNLQKQREGQRNCENRECAWEGEGEREREKKRKRDRIRE